MANLLGITYDINLGTDKSKLLGTTYDIVLPSHSQICIITYDILQSITENPNVQFWNESESQYIQILKFKLVELGSSYEKIIWLWNDKEDKNSVDMTLVQCKLIALTSTGQYEGDSVKNGQEIITEQWISAKSNGTQGSGITDDAQASFTKIGGNPEVSGNYLEIGDIPPQCARRIYIKIEPPAGSETVHAFCEVGLSFEVE